ncbi:hypothetical protein RB614_31195 [Phytohabitans sp. ZYX-F-186]|uniref:YfhO family protein n=1 Tax=Phytohabitans maris TaxID=3071409 RepID=A0ABU0ZPM9_9ACTN|nr:hypothetical protein [Phytohabitans sp. ZYX-F-186]MDQ7908999.1 hypothetical protein [Phytohabitans sp. ZYX-F-186]
MSWRWLRHEWTLAILGGLLLAMVLTWPTMRDPKHTVPGDIGDPTVFAWQVAWGGHALRTDPLGIWDSNTFYPSPNSLAFTDTLLGYAPFGMIGSGMDAAVLRYNLLYVLLHALAFIGAYALTRQLGAHPIGAAVAGVAWAYAPWRLAHAGHMNVISTGGIALSLAMIARGHGWSLRHGHRPERHRPGWALAGWLVAAWQITLGLATGLVFVYVVLIVCLAAAAFFAWSWWRRRERPGFGRRLLVADLVGGAFFGAATLYMGTAYLQVVDLNPQAGRSLDWTRMFSPPWQGLFIAPTESWLWGDRHAVAREQLSWPPEMALMPGLAVIVLAGMGLFFSVFRLRHRVLLALGVVVTALLSLGSTLGRDGDPGYLTLSKVLPGWDALRTPGRLMVWISLLLAILAAGAVSAIVAAVLRPASRPEASEKPAASDESDEARQSDKADGGDEAEEESGKPAGGLRSVRQLAVRAALLLPLALVLVEGINRTPHPEVPPYPSAMRGAPEPILVLPSEGVLEMPVMLWSTNGFPRIPNGIVTWVPTTQEQIRSVSTAFPDASSVAYLRQMGFRSVLVVRSWVPGTPWEAVPDRPVDGLGIVREEIDGNILYRLN